VEQQLLRTVAGDTSYNAGKWSCATEMIITDVSDTANGSI
jgi:hypothetical protein